MRCLQQAGQATARERYIMMYGTIIKFLCIQPLQARCATPQRAKNTAGRELACCCVALHALYCCSLLLRLCKLGGWDWSPAYQRSSTSHTTYVRCHATTTCRLPQHCALPITTPARTVLWRAMVVPTLQSGLSWIEARTLASSAGGASLRRCVRGHTSMQRAHSNPPTVQPYAPLQLSLATWISCTAGSCISSRPAVFQFPHPTLTYPTPHKLHS